MSTEKCYSCQAKEYKDQHGHWENEHAERHYWMWGCTCSYEAEEEAKFFMEVMTR